MLDKLKVIAAVGLVLQALRMFLGLEVPADFGPALEMLVNSLYIIVPVVAGWFVKERDSTVAALKTRSARP